jgi:hypothetical protein
LKKNKLRSIILAVTGLLWAGLAQSQESTNASGGDATGNGGTVAYSIGQVVYTTNSDNSGIVSEGVQQAYEIFTLGIEETEINILLSVFPNPTADNLILHTSNYSNESLSYQLYNLQGNLLSHGQINSEETQINTASLPSATYVIHVLTKEKKQVQSFKIIKTKNS